MAFMSCMSVYGESMGRLMTPLPLPLWCKVTRDVGRFSPSRLPPGPYGHHPSRTPNTLYRCA